MSPSPTAFASAMICLRAVAAQGQMSHSVARSLWISDLQVSSVDETIVGLSEARMIDGAHIVLYSKDPGADRAFFRDVLKFNAVHAGHGWLIFALPTTEAAFHDAEQNDRHELYFMCDDIAATVRELEKMQVPVSEVTEQRWGNIARFTLPGGGTVGIYQPKHPRVG